MPRASLAHVNAERQKKGMRPLTPARFNELDMYYTGHDFVDFAINFTLDAAEKMRIEKQEGGTDAV